MIELIQQKDDLIGSMEAINNLKQKEHARVIVISDIHGEYRALLQVIRRFGPECDAIIFCGDIERDLRNLLETAFADDDFRELIPPVMAFVRGNCDQIPMLEVETSTDDKQIKMERFRFPDRQYLTVNGQRILICHGHLESVEHGTACLYTEMRYNHCTIAVHGHTHKPANIYLMGNQYRIINPGSIHDPRDGYPATFAILTVEKDFVDTAFIETKSSLDSLGDFTVLKNFS